MSKAGGMSDFSTSLPTPVGPYTLFQEVDGFVVCSGQIGIAGADLVSDDFAGQFRQALKNVAAVLASTDLSLDDVFKTTVFLVSMDNYVEMNQVYGEFFTNAAAYPTRSAFAVAALPKGAKVEIEVWARR